MASLLERWLHYRMRRDWDRRARKNAFYYVDSERSDWSEAEIFRRGEEIVEQEILSDMGNICQGKPADQMRVLEIGCGIGRMTRALARVFGEVHAVDISGEMVARARGHLAGTPNAYVYQNSGSDLAVLGDRKFDFAFSTIVFQHIPSLALIENYVREVGRVLEPGRLFKFQVQGGRLARWFPLNSWVGASIRSEEEARSLAERCGFEARHMHGAGGQYFWLWFFKRREQ